MLRNASLSRVRPSGFFQRQDGATTVEFVVMLPVFIFIVGVAANAGTLFLIQSDMYNTARDAARRISSGELTNLAAVRNYANGRLFVRDNAYTITCTPVNCSPASKAEGTVQISTPIAGAALFPIAPFNSGSLVTSVTMRREPP